ncbi:mycofactocin-coupled SDR family oxidoreductase [Saccharomonospora sp. NPDC046836]|uniref:mycofactocin-coupled SDR family oxidoreductase n=1 Tax=Saccharomonospora sp. NPDC046836 TaxID=3156921 RepID=UPI003408A4F7
MSGRVAGKVALVTGAARGQGRAHAIRLAEEGADVIALDADKQIEGMVYPTGTATELAETARLVEATDRRVVTGRVDVRDAAALKSVVDAAVTELGGLDIVVANAGIAGLPFEAHAIPDTVWQQMIDINLTGVWHTVKAGTPHLLAGGRGGSIVLISSAAGLRAYANIAHYVAAKHGVVGLMRTLAVELAPHGIRANSIHPTQVNTPMINNPKTYELFCPGVENPTVEDFLPVSQAMNALPTPWVEPVDVSNAVLFLASDEARFITGATLPVDAGCLVK